MGNAYNSRRKQIVINKSVQSRIIFNMAWPAATCLALTAVILGVFSAQLSQEAILADVELPSLVPIFITVVCFLVVATGFLLFNALRFSHRIAGPMYRFSKTFEAVREGDLSIRANLRKHDYLGEVADAMNEFLEWLEEHPPQGLPQKQEQPQQQEQEQAQDSGQEQQLDQVAAAQTDGSQNADANPSKTVGSGSQD